MKHINTILITVPALCWAFYFLTPSLYGEQQDTTIALTDNNSTLTTISHTSLHPITVAYAKPQPTSQDNPGSTTATDPIVDTTARAEDRAPKINQGDGQGDCRITQEEDEHIAPTRGSVYAIDIHCGKKGHASDVYFPTGKKDFVILAIGESDVIGNYIILKHANIRYVYGHTVTSRTQGQYIDTTKDGNVLGQENKSGVWDGYHAHIEQWLCPDNDSPLSSCKNVSASGIVNPKSDTILEQRGWKKEYTYDPAVEKTPIKTFTLSDNIQIIACLNENDMTIHEPKGTGSSACYLGNGGKWKNILLPTREDWEIFHEVFGDELIYRLAIANFEGSFKETSGNQYAYGYLQTLRSYNIAPDIHSQLMWLKNREDNNTGLKCDRYLTEPYTLYDNMNIPASLLAKYTCMARGHYGFFLPSSNAKHYNHSIMYAKRYKAATEFYRSIIIQ